MASVPLISIFSIFLSGEALPIVIFTFSAVDSPMMRLCTLRTCLMIASSNSSPPTRMALVTTMPPREITEISVVPPPMSQIMCPAGSRMGMFAPMAAAMDSWMR